MKHCQQKTVDLHLSWWKRENRRPLIGHFAPLHLPHSGLDIDVPVEAIPARKIANAKAQAFLAQDLLVTQRVDFGPALLPALAGAGFEHDGSTSWNHAVVSSCRDATVAPFNPDHPLYRAYAERRDAMLKGWDGSFIPGHTNNVGPFDILAGIVGPETLAMDMLDDPQRVIALGEQAADFFSAFMHEEIKACRKVGLMDGMSDLYSIWFPNNGIRMVEDYSALVGPDLVESVLQPVVRRAVASFDSALFHTHSAAYRGLLPLTDTGILTAVEFGTDPGGPDLDTRLKTAQQLQAAGHPVQYGSWKYPLTPAERARVFAELNPKGLMVRFQAESPDEALRWYNETRRAFGE